MSKYECISIDKELVREELAADKTTPFLRTKVMIERTELRMNPDFPDFAMCDCGHVYYRHFDSYENYAPVGCKYCQCWEWHAPMEKAGIIPFQFVNGQIEMMFMIPSDPKYGGPKPQISKGFVDPTDEGSKAGAIREGQEELGLDLENTKYQRRSVFDVYKGTIMDEKEYTFALYAVEVLDRKAFNAPHFETGAVVWMSPRQFMEIGKEQHQELVRTAFKVIAENRGYRTDECKIDNTDFEEV